MRKLSAGLLFLFGLASPALAQSVTNPAPSGIAGAYNSSPPTITSGQFGYVQIDSAGRLSISPGSSGTPFLIDCSAANNVLCGLIGAAIPAGTNSIGNVGPLPYPLGATPITASATGTTGATTATLAGTSGKTTYICGYSIRANATAATTVTNTITGVVTATLSSIMWIAPAASGIGIDEQIFSPCIPASAQNTGIAIVSGAPGSGGNVSSKGWGYQL